MVPRWVPSIACKPKNAKNDKVVEKFEVHKKIWSQKFEKQRGKSWPLARQVGFSRESTLLKKVISIVPEKLKKNPYVKSWKTQKSILVFKTNQREGVPFWTTKFKKGCRGQKRGKFPKMPIYAYFFWNHFFRIWHRGFSSTSRSFCMRATFGHPQNKS